MPLPKAYVGVLSSATPDIIDASVHAVAALVLHLVGHQRLQREDIQRHAVILRELLVLLREESETKP